MDLDRGQGSRVERRESEFETATDEDYSDQLISSTVRWLVALVGIALLATGAVAVFVTSNSVGSSALIAAGAVAGVVALFANRIRTVEGAGVKIDMVVRSKLTAARKADEAGEPELAAQLRDQAWSLLAAAQPLAGRYESLRKEPTGDERTAKLERIVREWRNMARRNLPDPRFVEDLFDRGESGTRIGALAMMEEVPGLASYRG